MSQQQQPTHIPIVTRRQRIVNTIHSFYGIACAVFGIVALGMCIPAIIHYAVVLSPDVFPPHINDCIDRYFDDEIIGALASVVFVLATFLFHVGYIAHLYVRLDMCKYFIGCFMLVASEIIGGIFVVAFTTEIDKKCADVLETSMLDIHAIDANNAHEIACARALIDDHICRPVGVYVVVFLCIVTLHLLLHVGVVYTHFRVWLDHRNDNIRYQQVAQSVHENLSLSQL